MKKLLLTVALSALSAPALASAAPLPDADPAMWVVKDEDTTIYLFGTFHALDGKQDWLNDEIRTAFDQSQEVVLEIITPENPAEMLPIIQKHALDTSGRTLTSRLSEKGRRDLAAVLAKNGMPANALDSYRPFFASMMITMMQFDKIGMGAAHGTEAVLRKEAKGKSLLAVETVDQQLAMFASLDDAEQVKLLEQALAGEDEVVIAVKDMLKAWSTGDSATVAKMIQSTSTTNPALYKAVFPDRNAKWAEWIEQRLARPGAVFMAVGAGHLAGEDSVQRFLKDRGIESSRVPHVES